MGRAERFNYTSDEEKQSLINKAKKGVAAVALAATGLFASACSGGEGEAKGPSIGGILSAGGTSEVLYGQSCKEVENVVSTGTSATDLGLRPADRFPDLDTLKANAAVPDGIAKLSTGSNTGYLLDLDTLTSRQSDQLWESYNNYADELSPTHEKQTAKIIVYGEHDQSIIDEYKAGEGWPESMSDGVIDSPDLNLCVANRNAPIQDANWLQ